MQFNPITADTPMRLSGKTRELAAEYLSGENKNRLHKADFSISDLNLPPDTDANVILGKLSLLIAQKTPIVIVRNEKLAGCAPLLESVQHLVPGWPSMSSVSHTTADFQDAIGLGLSGLERELIAREREGLSSEQKQFCAALCDVIQAMRIWTKRHIAAYQELILKDVKNAENYRLIVQTLERVPENPPRTFCEAVQALWSFWEFQRLCGNWSGLGRLDMILGEYLERDLDEKIITLDEARELLAHFWIKGTEWCHGLAKNSVFKPGSGDAQVYQNVVLGGKLADGQNVDNKVSDLVLDIIEELHISDFPIAVRLNEQSSPEFLRRVAEVQLLGGGIVSIYNENIVLAALKKYGYCEAEAVTFTNDGCWEIIIPGMTAFGYVPFDALQILQQTLGELDEKGDFEALFQAYSANMQIKIEAFADQQKHYRCDSYWAGTTISLLMPACRQSCLSYNNRGTKYTVCAIHAGGLPDVANSLLALKKWVFEQKILSLQEFTGILQSDWQGHECLRLKIKKAFIAYGNDDCEADSMMQRIFNDFSSQVAAIHQRHGVLMPCGISTFGREIAWAANRWATPFGNRAHEYLASNLSPTPGTEKVGLTAIMNSYCKMDFTRTPNGCPLDLRLDAGFAKSAQSVEILITLINVFLQRGGFYLQIDVVDPEMLQVAQQNPDRYPNLAVRISGWSARFATLSKEWQDMIINRATVKER
ncbi:MAG: pyruvate formate lyase family protein [Lentisphaeria bacterium]